METKIVTKDEPLDPYDTEENQQVWRNGGDVESQYNYIKKFKVEYEENDNYEINITNMVKEPDPFSIVEEKSNKITVNVAESLKSEEEISFIKEIMDEEHEQNCGSSHSLMEYKLADNIIKNENSTIPLHECRRHCGKTFTTLTHRAFHENYEHERKPRTIKCNFCNQIFDSFFALTRHMPEHRNEHRYVCSYCSKCFSSYQDLQQHWKTNERCNAKKDKNLKEVSQLNNSSLLGKEIKNENQISSDLKPSINVLSQSTQLQKNSLSFADETKAFAAKYQLKNTSNVLVAKKRTSPITTDMVYCLKKFKKFKNCEVGILATPSQYAVPVAINNQYDVGYPLLNLKIKEEPPDVQDELNSVEFDEIQVKDEPIDYEYDSKNEPICEISVENSFSENIKLNDDISTTEVKETKKLFKKQKISTILNDFNLIELKPNNLNQSPPLHANKTSSNIKPTPPKNAKIFKLGPNAKIVKIPQTQKVKLEAIEIQQKPQIQQNPKFVLIKPKIEPVSPFVAIKVNLPEKLAPKIELISEKTTIERKEDCKPDIIPNEMEKVIIRGGKRINSVPKSVLRFIEQQPHTLQLIKDLQKQIKLAESLGSTTTSIVDISSSNSPKKVIKVESDSDTLKEIKVADLNILNNPTISTETASIDLPPPNSFFFNFSNYFDVEIKNIYRLHPKYSFSWICPRCSQEYGQKHLLRLHMANKHEISSEEYNELKVELRPYLNENIKSEIECEVDDKNLTPNPQSQKRNKKPSQETNKEGPSNFRCYKCGKRCSSRSMLNDHLAADCSRRPQYPCVVCGKSFYSAGTLKCHVTIHTGELPFKCNYCEKRFRTRGQVRVHHRTHTGEKPFQCQVCSQNFTHRETLISHLSRHIGMKRYRCYACNKHFACVSGLKTHRDVRPNTCGLIKLNTRAVGPRVRVVRGQVHFEPQPTINPYLRNDQSTEILSEIQNIQKT